MQKNPVAVLVLALASAPLFAQEGQEGPPGPAPELQKLAVYEGLWVGSGTAVMEPGKPASPWTSRTTYRWAMGGHFLQEDTIVESEGMPAPLVFHGYLGWDREKQRYVSAMMSNEGGAQLGEMHWLDENTVVSLVPTKRRGVPGFERSMSTLKGDTIDFEISIVQGAGPMVKVVEGKMKKVADAEPVALEASHTMAPAPAEMGKLARICGTYDVTGEMIPAPGAPAMKIRGEEVIEPVFGGAAVVYRIHGESEGMPGSYEAWGCMSWDEGGKCYRSIGVDNMGTVMETEGRWIGDDTFVHTAAGQEMGMPVVARSQIRLKADGSIEKVVAHAIHGAMDPAKSFEATYEKK